MHFKVSAYGSRAFVIVPRETWNASPVRDPALGPGSTMWIA